MADNNFRLHFKAFLTKDRFPMEGPVDIYADTLKTAKTYAQIMLTGKRGKNWEVCLIPQARC